MQNYFYSSKTNAFYPLILKEEYESANSWPTDAIAVSDDVYMNYSANPPAGKRRAPDGNGMPSWIDIPPPTKEKSIESAEQDKKLRIDYANSITADWRTELALDIISDEDKSKLTVWMKYIKAVKAVDVSTAPDVTWPMLPEA